MGCDGVLVCDGGVSQSTRYRVGLWVGRALSLLYTGVFAWRCTLALQRPDAALVLPLLLATMALASFAGFLSLCAARPMKSKE
jgi:hypothetical protein